VGASGQGVGAAEWCSRVVRASKPLCGGILNHRPPTGHAERRAADPVAIASRC